MPERMEKALVRKNFTGSAAISASAVCPAGQRWRFVGLTLHLNAAPAAIESLTVTLNNLAGAAYDVELNQHNLSGANLVLAPIADWLGANVADVYLLAGDAIDVAWANTGGKTYGLQLTFEVV